MGEGLDMKFHSTRLLILVVNLMPNILQLVVDVQNGTNPNIHRRPLGEDVTISEVQITIFSTALMCYVGLFAALFNIFTWGKRLLTKDEQNEAEQDESEEERQQGGAVTLG